MGERAPLQCIGFRSCTHELTNLMAPVRMYLTGVMLLHAYESAFEPGVALDRGSGFS